MICRQIPNATPSALTRSSKQIQRTRACNLKKLEGEDNIYSARIGLGYRALAVMKADHVVWYWIGNHSEYDRLV